MCTGIASYRGKPLYGMNFDFPDVELHFCIRQYGTKKVFLFNFLQNGLKLTTAGMNSSGLFADYQALIYNNESDYHVENKLMVMNNIVNPKMKIFETVVPHVLRKYNSADDISAYLSRKAFYFVPINPTPMKVPLRFHSLFADPQKAFICEIKNRKAQNIPMRGDYTVLSNFPHLDFPDCDYHDVHGFNSESYIKANDSILRKKGGFTVNSVMETLGSAVRTEGPIQTRCSLVFDPENQIVFVCFDRNFDRTWKFDIAKNTVEYQDSHDKIKSMPIPKKGLLKSRLLKSCNT